VRPITITVVASLLLTSVASAQEDTTPPVLVSYSAARCVAQDALLTAFVAQNAFIILPILVQRSKALFEHHGVLDERTDSAADVMIPVLFNFPTAGKLLTLLFVPFAAWVAGSPLANRDYGTLFAAGIPSYFANAQVALPFLLDLFGLSHDLFHLYTPTTIVTGNFDAMVTAMNLLVFALLGAGAMGGFLVFEPRRLVGAGAIIAGSLVATVFGVGLVLSYTIDTVYRMDEAVRKMHAAQPGANLIVRRDRPAPVAEDLDSIVLDRVRERGTLRAGYDEHNLPFSFFNSDGELVGFDVELTTQLATSLGVTAEFVPVNWEGIPDLLDQGIIDVMPGMWYRPNWFGKVRLSAPYMMGTMALVVRDERRHEFARIEDIRRKSELRVAIPLDQRQVQYAMERYFGEADVEFVVVDFWRSFFEGQHPDVDAFLMPAEHASAWSLLHPEYAVVVPQPDPIEVASGYGLALHARDLAEAVDEWIVFAKDTGAIGDAYNHWVLGQGAAEPSPRWSIMRDLLGIGSVRGKAAPVGR